MGRPRNVQPADLGDNIERMAGQGMTLKQIAQHLRVSKYAIETWLKDPAIRERYEHGRADAVQIVTNVVWKKAVEQEDLQAAMFWLKCQAGWNTRPKEEESPKVTVMVDPQGKVHEFKSDTDAQLALLKAIDTRLGPTQQ